MHLFVASGANKTHVVYNLHAQQRTSYFCFVVMHNMKEICPRGNNKVIIYFLIS